MKVIRVPNHIVKSNLDQGCECGNITVCLRHPDQPGYVCRGGTGQFLPLRHRWAVASCTFSPRRQIWLVLWSWSSSIAVRWGVVGEDIFSPGSCGYARKYLEGRDNWLIPYEEAFFLWAKSVETGTRHCAYVTKPNMDSVLGEPTWHGWHGWRLTYWTDLTELNPKWSRIQKGKSGTMHYIYVVLSSPGLLTPCRVVIHQTVSIRRDAT